MPPTSPSLRRLVSAVHPAATPDPHLLRAFVADRCEAAFAELVRRHGPMVRAVCRRVLGHPDDADDAFQAAFLVLARKAGSVRGSNLAGWLYAVAVRTARGVRLMRDRRRRHETANGRREPAGQLPDQPAHAGRSPEQLELTAIIDEELAGLPECYRVAVVLCELQGRSRKDAAADLGIPEGTLSSRLAKARRLLADRLTQRGITAPAAAVTAALVPTAGPVSAGLVRAVVRSALVDGVASGTASAAADGVVKALLVAKLKAGAVAVGLAAGFVAGVGVATVPGGGTAVAASDPEKAPPPRPVLDPAVLVEQLGDDDFAAREAAGKALRALGPKARAAVEAGTRSPNPEVARRSGEVLRLIRADALAAFAKSFDPAATTDYDHPVWRRFRAVVGGDRESRELFAQVIADKDRLRLLADAEDDPGRAGDLYEREGKQLYEKYKNRLDPPNTGQVDLTILPLPEAAALTYLGTYPATTGKPDPWWINHRLLLPATARGVPADWRPDPPARRLFVAWLARRDREQVLTDGLERAAAYQLTEVLPLARAVAADPARPAKVRCAALSVFVRLGSTADLPAFEARFADESVIDTFRLSGAIVPGSKIDGSGTVQARDLAVGLALLLFGRDPAEFGFYVAEKRWQMSDGKLDLRRFQPFHFGFMTGDDDGRPAAHRKARAWLAERAKEPSPAVEPAAGLLADLDELDKMRQGESTDFAAVEKRGAELLAKYPRPADQGRIYFTLTRVYSNSGIGRTFARVEKYGRLALKHDSDPARRGEVYSALASAAEVAVAADPLAADPFPVKRKRAAGVVLEGYKELLPLKLPAVAPELPGVEKVGDIEGAERAKALERHAAQMAARRQAKFVRDMVHQRDTYVIQLKNLYGREPKADDELRELVGKGLNDPATAADLLERVAKAR